MFPFRAFSINQWQSYMQRMCINNLSPRGEHRNKEPCQINIKARINPHVPCLQRVNKQLLIFHYCIYIVLGDNPKSLYSFYDHNLLCQSYNFS